MTSSLIDLNNGLSGHKENLTHTISIKDHILQKDALTDSLARAFILTGADDQFYHKATGFEVLKSLGLKTLTNDSLRQEITSLFQLGFPRIVGMGRDEAPVRNFSYMRPFIDKYRNLSVSINFLKANEYDSIIH